MKVVVPSTAYDAKGLMHNAIRDDDPVVYLFHKRLMGIGWLPAPDGPKTGVPEDEYTIPFGSADVKREGADVTVVTLGLHVHRALEAAESLADDGIDVEVVDLRTLVPLDTETVRESVAKTGHLVVVDEDYQSYGVTGEIIARVAEGGLDDLEAVERVAVPDVPIPYARPMEDEVVPDADDITNAIRNRSIERMSANDERVAVDTADVWPDDADEDEGVVVNWFLSDGSRVEEGDALCEYQVEKVSVDVPAPVTGTLDELVLEEDDEFERGDVLAWIRPE